jgi:hypothetical protein
MRGLLAFLGSALLGKHVPLFDRPGGFPTGFLHEVERGRSRNGQRSRRLRMCVGSHGWRAYKNRVEIQRRSRQINQGL